jgi:hypothetical protein
MPNDTATNTNSWGEWSRLVLSELDRLGKQQDRLDTKISDFQLLQTKQVAEIDTKVTQLQTDVNKLKKNGGSGNGTLNSSDAKELGETKGELKTWTNIWMWVFVAIIGFAASIIGQVAASKWSSITHPTEITDNVKK